MILFVGQASIKGDFRKYAKHFNYVELLAEPQVLPNLKKLAQLAKEAGPRVKFGVVLSPRAWGAEQGSFRTYFDKVVKATNPWWVVVRTPPSLRPGPSSERELRLRFDELRQTTGQAHLAWEARGLWEPADIARVARESGVVPVWDGFSPPRFSLGDGDNYVRISALGVAGRVNEGRLERLALQASESKSLVVVVEGKGALKTRQVLSSLFEDPFLGVEDALDFDESEQPAEDEVSDELEADESELTEFGDDDEQDDIGADEANDFHDVDADEVEHDDFEDDVDDGDADDIDDIDAPKGRR